MFKRWLARYVLDYERIAMALYSKYVEDGRPDDIWPQWFYTNYVELCRVTGYPMEAGREIQMIFERIKNEEIKENFIV